MPSQQVQLYQGNISGKTKNTKNYSPIPMSFHVFLAVDGGLEGLLAVGTHEGAHLAVGGHVSLQGAIGGEGRVTHQTLVTFHPRVCAGVRFQHAARHKAVQALGAAEWFLTWCEQVNHLVLMNKHLA